MKRRLKKIILFVLALTACSFWWTGGLDRVKASTESGRDKAQALVAAYAKHIGAHDAVHQTLDEDNDRSFGDFAFHYFSDRNVLQARIFIVRSHLKDWPDSVEFEKKSNAGLNDPKIGGMYDRGGGYFFLDEDKQIVFLAKNYPLAELTASSFIKDVDNLNDVGALWVKSWLAHAARQSYGAEPLPTHRIDREHNPYKE